MAAWLLLSGVWSLSGNVANLVASSRGRARIGGHGQTIKCSQASSQRSQPYEAVQGWSQNGTQSSPGCRTWPGAHSQDCRCSRADLNPPVSKAEHGNAVSPGHAVRGRPNRKAGKRGQHGEDRRSQGQRVMRWICPRRSGLEWQESMRNHFQTGRANDERRQPLSASRSCWQRNTAQIGRRPALPSCPRRLRCVLKMHRILSSSGRPHTGASLERLEPCEGKLSCTVLRGARAG